MIIFLKKDAREGGSAHIISVARDNISIFFERNKAMKILLVRAPSFLSNIIKKLFGDEKKG